jgi:hypothetical protein
MNATVHKFPSQDGARQWLANQAPPPEVEVFDRDKVKELQAVVQHVFQGSSVLVDFLQADRELARKAGIESLCIEITAILEGGKFDRVMDTLEEAVQKNTPVTLTKDGLSRIRRLESLLAEADRNIGRFVPGRMLSGKKTGSGELGQQLLISIDPLLMGSMIVLGVIGVTLIVYAVVTDRK